MSLENNFLQHLPKQKLPVKIGEVNYVHINDVQVLETHQSL